MGGRRQRLEPQSSVQIEEVLARLSAKRRADPQLAEEIARYGAAPLPSRAYILEQVKAAARPLRVAELIALLEIAPEERAAFERRLDAMVRDGQLVRNRRGALLLPEKASLIAGVIEGHPDGFGWLKPDEGTSRLLVPAKEMRAVMHGDRVLVRPAGKDERGRNLCKVVEVLQRAEQPVVGRIVIEHGVRVLVPEDRRIGHEILIAPSSKKRLAVRAGDVAVARIIEPPTRYTDPIGEIVEVLGRATDPGIEVEIAVRKHGLPHCWNPELRAEVRRLPRRVSIRQMRDREDLRDLAFVTIDGESARDFDDAVFCEPCGKGFRLLVAIADVAHYVASGSALDEEALLRGTSVYFPRRVLPMLPEKLSDDLCSLRPLEDRLAMVCEMFITPRGAIERFRFFPAVIRSRARLTYTQVAAALYEGKLEAREALGALLTPLEQLDAVFRILAKARQRRGALDFDTPEVAFEFDEANRLAAIRPVRRNNAHRLIEECMLAANVCASRLVLEHEHPVLYRVHEPPAEEEVEKLRLFLAGFGLVLKGGSKPQPRNYRELLQKIAGRPEAPLLQTVLLRSLKQARYTPDNAGHFGLAYEHYTHFTSPIRRYPDLLVHRVIKAILAGEVYKPSKSWQELGEHCSAAERRADEASRDVEHWLKCLFLENRVGEIFTGTISGVTPFGIFVALDETLIEGLVHISELGEDYFHYDEVRHRLIGERTKAVFQLADRVEVQVARVDLERARIDFRLVKALREKCHE